MPALAQRLAKRALAKRDFTKTTSIIVIVVVVVSLLASIAFCFLIFWLIRRRQKRVDARVRAAIENRPVGGKTPILTTEEYHGLRGGEYQAPELDGRAWVEMEGCTARPVAEADSGDNLIKERCMEMEGSPVYDGHRGARI